MKTRDFRKCYFAIVPKDRPFSHMSQPNGITILPFERKYQSEARMLILAGLAEHWGTPDPTKNPDLNDISQTYGDAVFLVARQNNKIVGTGALVPKSNGIGEIVRMSVAAHMRRKGVGTMILRNLCAQARLKGYKLLVLETTATWSDVVEFYRRFGFQITHYLDGDLYFCFEI